MVQSDRANSVWHNDIIITGHSWLVLSCISSQWARCSTFKYLANVCGSSLQHTPETFARPQLHLYRSAMRWFMYAIGVILCIYVQQQYFLHAQQYVVYVLAVASLGTCSAAAAATAWQIYSDKTKYINIVMYITMQITPRVVMTELIIPPVGTLSI